MRRNAFLLVSIIWITCGCTATPDLSEWSAASTDLKTSVSASQRQMLASVNSIVDDLKQGESEGWPEITDGDRATWRDNQAQFAANVAAIETSLTIMTGYASQISLLANAAEGGEDASNSLFDSMNGILDAADIPFTGSQAALAGSKAIIDKVAAIVTRIKGQASLLAAMSQMQNAVDLMASEIISSSNAIKMLVHASANTQRKLARLKFGPHKLRYLSQTQTYSEIENAFKQDDANDMLERLAILEKMRDSYREYEQQIQSIKQARSDSYQQIDGIIQAAQAWQSSHKRVIQLLEECGGIWSLRTQCGHLNLTNLTASIDWVKATKVTFEGQSEQIPHSDLDSTQ